MDAGGSGIVDFKDLVAWQRAMKLAAHVYRITLAFPSHEQFGLTAQLRRAAVSICSNIAEGHARQGAEFYRFLSMARGSAAEVETQLLLSVELGYQGTEEIGQALQDIRELGRLTAGLMRRLRPTP